MSRGAYQRKDVLPPGLSERIPSGVELRDLNPPYTVETYKQTNGHLCVEVCSAWHVVARMVSGTNAERIAVARLIVDACNNAALDVRATDK